MRRSFAFFAVLGLSLAALSLHAQMPPSSSSTSTPVPGVGHDYIGEIAETVDPATGSLSIRVGVPIPPGRGITVPFSFAYDSAGVNYVSNNLGGVLQWLNPSKTIVSSGGWSNTVPVVSVSELSWTAVTNLGHSQACFAFVNYEYQDAHGDRHNLNLSTYNQAGNPNGACTYDSAHWPLSFGGAVVTQKGEASPGAIMASIPSNATINPGPVTVVDSDGTTFSFPNVSHDTGGSLATSIEDRNGNIVTIHPPVSPSTNYNYADTAGRTVLQDTGFGISPETVTVAGLGGTYSLQWTALSTPTFSVPVTTVSGNACNFGGSHQAWSGQNAISTLTLPNGKHFTFTYDPTYKLISRMTYPSGGYIRYVWGVNTQAEIGANTTSQSNAQCTALYGMPAITDRYVSFDGSTEVLHQHFQYSTAWNLGNFSWTSKATTVTTSDLVRGSSYTTMYTYSPLNADHPPNSGPPTNFDPVESSVQYNDLNGATIKTVSKTWLNPRLLSSETVSYPTGQASKTIWTYNTREQEIEKDEYDYGSNGVGPLLRKTVTNYQQFNLNLYPNAPSIADKICQQIIYDGTGTNRVAETDYFYDNGATGAPCGTAGTPIVTSVSGVTGHDETKYSATSTTPRGNLTQKTQWLNTGNSPVTTYTYDEAGQIISLTDPCGHVTCADMVSSSHTTNYSYADSYTILSNGQNQGYTPAGDTDAYLTRITDAMGHGEKFTYDFNNGQLTASTDVNLQTTTYLYNDSLSRPTLETFPDSGQTAHSYNDTAPSPTATTCQNVNGTAGATCNANSPPAGWRTSIATMDGIEHVIQTKLVTDPDCSTGDIVSTSYDGSGQVYTKSNSYCSTSDSSYGVTTFTYDALGRTTKVAHSPDGTFATTTYTSRATDTVDEGNGTRSTERISQVDGLGRLVSMCEVTSATQLGGGGTPAACNQDVNKTGFLTTYNYDALNNLLRVQQGTLTNRTFSYDSLSRHLCAANPENGGSATCPSPDGNTYTAGTIRYSYDVNGNGATRMRPAPNQANASTTVTTSYQYDALNRLTQATYSDGVTLAAQFAYDQSAITIGAQQVTITNSVGRLSSTCVLQNSSCPTMTANSYDPMGRIAQFWQSNPTNNNLWVKYQYDLIGDETSRNLTGWQFALAYNSIGRLTAFTAQNFVDATNPANILANAHYDAFGHLVSATLASGLTESWAYDNRGRLHAFALGTNCSAGTCTGSTVYSHSMLNPSTGQTGYAPNGDILFANDNVNGNWAYTYDDFNRLASSNENNGQQTYSYDYDRYGNRWHQNAPNGGSSSLLSFSGNNNRIDGYSYDAEGNLLNDGFHNYQYDPENRIISVDGNTTYTYDANGRRVLKSAGSTQTETVYDGHGDVNFYITSAAGSTPAPNSPNAQLYVGGMHIGGYVVNSTVTDTVFYYNHADWLGSERARTNLSGVACETIANLSFGDGQTIAGSCGDISPMHFTGKERDSESGLDNFGPRYDASAMGRFMSPDPSNLSVDFWIPQTWNRYTYALNNPLIYVDRNGLWPTRIHNEIYKEAFPGLSSDDLKTLQTASRNVDFTNRPFGLDPQDPALSGIHEMSDGNDPDSAHAVGVAEQIAERNIIDNESAATAAQADWIATGHTGISPKALTAFGNALHTVTDGTSPAHEGFQPWYGTWHLSSLIHVLREQYISSSRKADAVAAARASYLQTFGFWELERALDGLEPHVSHKITFLCGGNNQSPCPN